MSQAAYIEESKENAYYYKHHIDYYMGDSHTSVSSLHLENLENVSEIIHNKIKSDILNKTIENINNKNKDINNNKDRRDYY